MSFGQVMHDSICIFFPLHTEKKQSLFSAEMRKIIETGDWLTDQHMSLAQEILKGQFSHIDGWQSTLLVQIDGFIPIIGETIQIHLVSDSHWITSSSLGGKVTVYDCRM